MTIRSSNRSKQTFWIFWVFFFLEDVHSTLKNHPSPYIFSLYLIMTLCFAFDKTYRVGIITSPSTSFMDWAILLLLFFHSCLPWAERHKQRTASKMIKSCSLVDACWRLLNFVDLFKPSLIVADSVGHRKSSLNFLDPLLTHKILVDSCVWSIRVSDQLITLHNSGCSVIITIRTFFVSFSAISDNIFQLSFVLSNTSWNESYLNSSHPQYQTLKDAIMLEVSHSLYRRMYTSQFRCDFGCVSCAVSIAHIGWRSLTSF